MSSFDAEETEIEERINHLINTDEQEVACPFCGMGLDLKNPTEHFTTHAWEDLF